MHTTDMKPTNCPKCDHLLDRATRVGEEEVGPEPGDLTVCINCGAVLEFDDDLNVTELTDEQRGNLPPVTQVELNQVVRLVLRAKGQ